MGSPEGADCDQQAIPLLAQIPALRTSCQLIPQGSRGQCWTRPRSLAPRGGIHENRETRTKGGGASLPRLHARAKSCRSMQLRCREEAWPVQDRRVPRREELSLDRSVCRGVVAQDLQRTALPIIVRIDLRSPGSSSGTDVDQL
jgi:hypothetical protein